MGIFCQKVCMYESANGYWRSNGKVTDDRNIVWTCHMFPAMWHSCRGMNEYLELTWLLFIKYHIVSFTISLPPFCYLLNLTLIADLLSMDFGHLKKCYGLVILYQMKVKDNMEFINVAFKAHNICGKLISSVNLLQECSWIKDLLYQK